MAKDRDLLAVKQIEYFKRQERERERNNGAREEN